MEFIGTFFLTLIICLTTGNYLAPIAIGSLLSAIIYMGYSISGAHFNPAVTLAVFICKKISMKDSLFYIGSQFLGSFSAAYFYFSIWGRNIGNPHPSLDLNILKPFAIEIVFTFILALVVLFVAASKNTQGNNYYGMAIGLTIIGIGTAGSTISGGGYNPAVASATTLVDVLFGACECHPSKYVWIYFAGPFLGSALAAFAFKVLSPEDFQEN